MSVATETLAQKIVRLQDEVKKAEATAEATKTAKNREIQAILVRMASEYGVKPETQAQTQAAETKSAPATNGSHKRRTRGAQKKPSTVKPLYRNPSKPDETWTGRGRAPRWLAALENQGAKREAFRISAQ
jgi:DNA-binding protein H-NS